MANANSNSLSGEIGMYDVEELKLVAERAIEHKIREDLEAELLKLIQPAIDSVIEGLMDKSNVQAYIERVMTHHTMGTNYLNFTIGNIDYEK